VLGGADPGDPVSTPYAPELRAFVLARLGDDTPRGGWTITGGRKGNPHYTKHAKAFAALLREVADGIDPPGEIAP
jgi:hypothetical protein